jgi:hypothetical protein
VEYSVLGLHSRRNGKQATPLRTSTGNNVAYIRPWTKKKIKEKQLRYVYSEYINLNDIYKYMYIYIISSFRFDEDVPVFIVVETIRLKEIEVNERSSLLEVAVYID